MNFSTRHAMVALGLCALAALLIGGLVFYGRHRALPERAYADLRESPEITITLTDEGFEPKQVRVRQGTKVIFTTTRGKPFWPASDAHPSHAIYPQFDPREPIAPSASWSFVVDRRGEWGFHDHVRSYFTGRILVE